MLERMAQEQDQEVPQVLADREVVAGCPQPLGLGGRQVCGVTLDGCVDGSLSSGVEPIGDAGDLLADGGPHAAPPSDLNAVIAWLQLSRSSCSRRWSLSHSPCGM